MSGPSRPTLHWLLWLVIALLPLRGWAWAEMTPAELAPAAAPALMLTSTTGADELPPCHLGAAHQQTHAQAADDAQPGAEHAHCSQCALCHAAASPAAATPWSLPDTQPGRLPTHVGPVAPCWSSDAPERPPKA